MMLYLTGATSSIERSGGNSPQTDVNKSLGGYISSTPVPNGSLNALFDSVSLISVQRAQPETLGFGLVNEFSSPMDVKIRIITHKNAVAKFAIAAVATENGSMERIGSRYALPLYGEFYDASFSRASVEARIEQYAGIGEEILLLPFGVTAKAEVASWDGTFQAIQKAFDGSEYKVTRVSRRRFVVERLADDVVEPQTCRAVSTGAAAIKFFSDLKNDLTGEVNLGVVQPGQIVGLWLQRTVKKEYRTNEQILRDRKIGYIEPTEEDVEVVIEFNPEQKEIPLNELSIGYNLRNKTIEFTHTFTTPPKGKEETLWINNDQERIQMIHDGGDEGLTQIFFRSEEPFNMVNFYDEQYGWIGTKYTFPDDKDYIVTANDLQPHIGDDWGFDYAHVIE